MPSTRILGQHIAPRPPASLLVEVAHRRAWQEREAFLGRLGADRLDSATVLAWNLLDRHVFVYERLQLGDVAFRPGLELILRGFRHTSPPVGTSVYRRLAASAVNTT